MTAALETYAAVVLAGGGGVRLGGRDKASLEYDGATLLDRALAAATDAAEVVVVGTELPTERAVTFTREDPPGGGPAAGLLAGLDALATDAPVVLALAVDMPLLTADTVRRLRTALAEAAEADGAVLVDGDGRRQTLAAVYRRTALHGWRPTRRADEHGLPVRRLLADARLVEVPELPGESHDIDVPEDLARRDG